MVHHPFRCLQIRVGAPELVHLPPLLEEDPRRAQLDLAGSLGEKEAAKFMAQLCSLMRCGLLAAPAA